LGKLDISDIRVRLVNKSDNKLKAVASMTINGCFVIHDVRIIEGVRGNFMAMPSRKTPEGEYKDICHPIDPTTRAHIEELILKAYEAELKK